MRDKLIHGYFGVDLGAVWDTATKDIPPLREKLREILKTEEKKWVRFGFLLGSRSLQGYCHA